MAEQPANTPKIRVLLADDHRIVRQGLVHLLKLENDMEVVGEAADGAAAVELAQAHRPDIVLMDVNMPRTNGIDATRTITHCLPQVRVIGVSMHNDRRIAGLMRDAGAQSFVAKDRPYDELVQEIRRIWRRR